MAKLCIYRSFYFNISFIGKNKLIKALIKTFIPIFIITCAFTSNLA